MPVKMPAALWRSVGGRVAMLRGTPLDWAGAFYCDWRAAVSAAVRARSAAHVKQALYVADAAGVWSPRALTHQAKLPHRAAVNS